ncbi:hypothetical protein FN846DRAFT_256743 [Sphaerosporella brunnea]|uniref:Transmembrane protein n=1 Tax=Sphaerosporella brunnea TaxID=1250544 RepID=A0A5J5F7U7_9PEZI|nr:hypothetical protein FN846DRAFT_256743 [Sphaerosporella brunnea]
MYAVQLYSSSPFRMFGVVLLLGFFLLHPVFFSFTFLSQGGLRLFLGVLLSLATRCFLLLVHFGGSMHHIPPFPLPRRFRFFFPFGDLLTLLAVNGVFFGISFFDLERSRCGCGWGLWVHVEYMEFGVRQAIFEPRYCRFVSG